MADFLSTLQSFESGDRRHPERGGSNIANTTEGTTSGQAQGYNQITTGTWKEFGGLAYAPTPLQATQEQQNAIAAKIPLKRWDPKTLAFLTNNGFKLNPNATLGDNIAANHGTLGTAPPPHTPTPGTTINTTTPSGGSGSPAGGPAAAPATGQPAPAQESLASKLGSALKPLAGNKSAGGSGDGSDDDQPRPMQLPQAPQAQAMGGMMMLGPGGQNTFGARAAQQGLAQQGYMMQPTLAAFNNPYRPAPVPQSGMPGAASGVPGMPGTTLNSPSQLQMALMSGQMSPYDMYANAGGGFGYGST